MTLSGSDSDKLDLISIKSDDTSSSYEHIMPFMDENMNFQLQSNEDGFVTIMLENKNVESKIGYEDNQEDVDDEILVAESKEDIKRMPGIEDINITSKQECFKEDIINKDNDNELFESINDQIQKNAILYKKDKTEDVKQLISDFDDETILEELDYDQLSFQIDLNNPTHTSIEKDALLINDQVNDDASSFDITDSDASSTSYDKINKVLLEPDIDSKGLRDLEIIENEMELNLINEEDDLIKNLLLKLVPSDNYLLGNPYLTKFLQSIFTSPPTNNQARTQICVRNINDVGKSELGETETIDQQFILSTMILVLLGSFLVTTSFLFFDDKSYHNRMNRTFMRASPYYYLRLSKTTSPRHPVVNGKCFPNMLRTNDKYFHDNASLLNYFYAFPSTTRHQTLLPPMDNNRLTRAFPIHSSLHWLRNRALASRHLGGARGNLRLESALFKPTALASTESPGIVNNNQTPYLEKMCAALRRESAQRIKVWRRSMDLRGPRTPNSPLICADASCDGDQRLSKPQPSLKGRKFVRAALVVLPKNLGYRPVVSLNTVLSNSALQIIRYSSLNKTSDLNGKTARHEISTKNLSTFSRGNTIWFKNFVVRETVETYNKNINHHEPKIPRNYYCKDADFAREKFEIVGVRQNALPCKFFSHRNPESSNTCYIKSDLTTNVYPVNLYTQAISTTRSIKPSEIPSFLIKDINVEHRLVVKPSTALSQIPTNTCKKFKLPSEKTNKSRIPSSQTSADLLAQFVCCMHPNHLKSLTKINISTVARNIAIPRRMGSVNKELTHGRKKIGRTNGSLTSMATLSHNFSSTLVGRLFGILLKDCMRLNRTLLAHSIYYDMLLNGIIGPNRRQAHIFASFLPNDFKRPFPRNLRACAKELAFVRRLAALLMRQPPYPWFDLLTTQKVPPSYGDYQRALTWPRSSTVRSRLLLDFRSEDKKGEEERLFIIFRQLLNNGAYRNALLQLHLGLAHQLDAFALVYIDYFESTWKQKSGYRRALTVSNNTPPTSDISRNYETNEASTEPSAIESLATFRSNIKRLKRFRYQLTRTLQMLFKLPVPDFCVKTQRSLGNTCRFGKRFNLSRSVNVNLVGKKTDKLVERLNQTRNIRRRSRSYRNRYNKLHRQATNAEFYAGLTKNSLLKTNSSHVVPVYSISPFPFLTCKIKTFGLLRPQKLERNIKDEVSVTEVAVGKQPSSLTIPYKNEQKRNYEIYQCNKSSEKFTVSRTPLSLAPPPKIIGPPGNFNFLQPGFTDRIERNQLPKSLWTRMEAGGLEHQPNGLQHLPVIGGNGIDDPLALLVGNRIYGSNNATRFGSPKTPRHEYKRKGELSGTLPSSKTGQPSALSCRESAIAVAAFAA